MNLGQEAETLGLSVSISSSRLGSKRLQDGSRLGTGVTIRHVLGLEKCGFIQS